MDIDGKTLEPVTRSNVRIGMQVIYIPSHVIEFTKLGGNPVDDDSVEYGFVTNYSHGTVFCRFFYPNKDLRTKANSESTPYESLFILPEDRRVPQEFVDNFIEENYRKRGV